MVPFFKSKFFKFSALSLSIIAVSTPFWLFSSEQSIVRTNNSKPILHDTQGTIDLASLNTIPDTTKGTTTSKGNNSPSTQEAFEPQRANSKPLLPSHNTNNDDASALTTSTNNNTESSSSSSSSSSIGNTISSSVGTITTKAPSKSAKHSVSHNITDKVVEPNISEQPLSLEQKVQAITQSQSSEQKAQYLRSLEERHELVDAAIASIAEHSKMYLPPLISERALVITFDAPCLEGKGKLPKEQQDYGFDITTGATVVKDDSGTNNLMHFIAATLSRESGADLYYINPARTYPKSRKQLYQFALNELTQESYPELTDDVPLHIDNYDTIYLCYPIWWSDLPGALYSFLIKYDLSDKTVIPVCINSGDGFAQTLNTISTYEPHANIYHEGLLLSTKDTQLSPTNITDKIRLFLQKLVSDFN